jgi:phage gpG-like protein
LIKVTVENTVTSWVELAGARFEDLTVPLTKILDHGLTSAQLQILNGKGAAFGGVAWAPMAPSTARRRDPATLLVNTGRLAGSFARGGPDNVFEVGPTEAVGGTSVPYAGYQYAGTGRIPARPFPMWYDEFMPDYEKIILDWLELGSA